MARTINKAVQELAVTQRRLPARQSDTIFDTTLLRPWDKSSGRASELAGDV